jgi:hypothetical protein
MTIHHSRPLKKKGLKFYTPFVVGMHLLTRPFLPPKPHILLACLPKSGSTFLSNALAECSGIRRVGLVPTYGERYQELCELRLARYHHNGYVSQLHIQNSEWTQELVRRYNITPIILVRDIPDCIISMREHFRREPNFGFFTAPGAAHASMSDDEIDALIVRFAMPWYISFYAGWKRAGNVLFIDYEDAVNNPKDSLKAILDFAHSKRSDLEISTALEKVQGKSNRFNKGIAGRGAALKAESRDKLKELLSFYPEIAADKIFQNI